MNKRSIAPEPSDAREIFNQACGAWQGAEIIGQKDLAVPIYGSALILSAFSVELFLKCLVIIDGSKKYKPTHLLNTLFDDLSHNRQAQISRAWEDTGRRKIQAVADNQGVDSDLRNLLSICAMAFRNIRYSFEGFRTAYYLWPLPPILYELICVERPEWAWARPADTLPKQPT
jgi:hypothetical protein